MERGHGITGVSFEFNLIVLLQKVHKIFIKYNYVVIVCSINLTKAML
jgi:hypothetical protein